MTLIILLAVAGLASCLGGPALFQHLQAVRVRRAEERVQAIQARQRQQEEHDRLWREQPDLAGLAERLTYLHQVQLHLQHAVTAARGEYERLRDHVTQRAAELREGRPITAMYKVIVLGGLMVFIAAIALSVVLDYLIFRGLHPAGTALLPACLAFGAVVSMAIGSVMMLGAHRHGLLPASVTPYWRRVVATAGICLVIGTTWYMAAIAPDRSKPVGNRAIQIAAQNLADDQNSVPPSPAWQITADKLQLAQAQSTLADQETVDRLFSLVLAAIEVPSSEAAILGCGLLAVLAAARRRDRSQRETQRAENELEVANTRWYATILPELARHGHGEEVFSRIHARLLRMQAAVPPPVQPDGIQPPEEDGHAPGGDAGAGPAAPDGGPRPVVEAIAEPAEDAGPPGEPILITTARDRGGWTVADPRPSPGPAPEPTADLTATDFSPVEFDEAS